MPINYSIAFDLTFLPDLEPIFREFSSIGIVKSIEVTIITSLHATNKCTVVVHYHLWYDTNLSRLIEDHFNRNEVVTHEAFVYPLRKSHSKNIG